MGQKRCRQVIYGHPCYGGEAYHAYGRIHLPVAPRCNIGCNYCVRRHHCANENRPGVTSRILRPEEALARVRAVVSTHPWVRVVGVAGPGDPLANERTFETLRLVHVEFPSLIKCISTNGLLLPDRVEELVQVGVSSVTVTVNSVNPSVGARIYSWARYGNDLFAGKEAAELLIGQQLEGLKRAKALAMAVRVNTVLIPEVNGEHVVEVASVAGQLGVDVMNLIPLIPQGKFSGLRAPEEDELARLRRECEPFVPQFRGCRQCRADSVGMLGEVQMVSQK